MASTITASTTSGSALTFSSDTSGTLAILTGASPTTAMTIDSSQNVGIGTASPGTKLHLKQTTDSAGGGLWVQDSGANTTLRLWADATNVYVYGGSAGNVPLISNGSYLAYQTAGTERMRINSAGNVGIGTASPATNLVVSGSGAKTLQVTNTTIGEAASDGTILQVATSGVAYLYNQENAAMIFGTNNTEAMRILAGQSVAFGLTTNVNGAQIAVGGNGIALNNDTGTLIRGADTAGTTFGALSLGQSFGAGSLKDVTLQLANNAGQRIYVQNRTAGVYLADGGTSWTSNSDERIKKNLVPIEDAANKVSSLRAVIGEYIDDPLERKRPFLIAQDLDAVLPEAVDKTKEDVWGVQYSDVIPLLVAAIKEQQALITQLQADVAALKGTK